MSKIELYKQCKLKQKTKEGYIEHNSWISDKYSLVGKNLKIDNMDGLWEVIEVYEHSRTKEDLVERSQDYKKQRKASDI